MSSEFLTIEWGCLQSKDGSQYVNLTLISIVYYNQLQYLDLHGLCSKQEKITMDILHWMTWLGRWIMQSTSLKNAQMDWLRGSFFSTMLLVIKSMLMMLFPQEKCQKIRHNSGLIEKEAHRWGIQSFPMAQYNLFTLMKTTPLCPDGSKAWKWLSGKEAFGRNLGFLLSAKDLNMTKARPTAAAAVFYSINPTLWPNNHNLKNTSLPAVTFVIFTPNIIVSLILLNSTGMWQSSTIGTHPRLATLIKWKQMWQLVSMIYHWFKSEGIYSNFTDLL